jgi:eukaryotic-like serine/threonine-protein kinase
MTISVVCHSCGSKLRVPETSAGRSVKCPKCSKSASVPASSAAVSESSTSKGEGASQNPALAKVSATPPKPTPPSPAAKERNLLFGVLALQAALIDQDELAEVCALWSTRKSVALGDLLAKRGMLSASDRQEVERLVDRHLKSHGGDAASSLAAALDWEARSVLSTLDDAEVRQSVDSAPEEDDRVQVPTQDYVPEARQRYTLTHLHAKGGIGQIWLARDGALGREIALKELRPERVESRQIENRFVIEAQVTGQLEHPGIVPVYELVRPAGQQPAFYTMRFVRGRTLSRAARAYHKKRANGKAETLDQRALLNAFVNVCNAIAYAHSRGVIHRDLKGANVILGGFGEVVVLDWGLAKIVGAVEADGDVPPVAVDRTDDS